MEIWKDIPGYEGLYQASTYGRIKSLPKFKTIPNTTCYTKERILKGAVSKLGYLVVNLYKNGTVKSFRINRLIGLTFIDNPQNLPWILHNDDNTLNNKVENLRWGTPKDNSKDMVLRNRQNKAKGEKAGQSKLSEQQVLEIRKKYIKRKITTYELSKKYGVAQSNICNIINRKIWKHI